MLKSPWLRVAAVILAALLAACLVLLKDRAPGAGATGPGSDSGLPRLVELGSQTCTPCQMMKPIIEGLRRDYAGVVSVESVDVNRDPAAVQQFGIRAIPTQVFIDAAGREVARNEGYIAREDIEEIFLTYFGVTRRPAAWTAPAGARA
jgi:thioredoxin 1